MNNDTLNDAFRDKNILLIKSRFFLSRALGYSSLLLLPIWLPKSLHLSSSWQSLIMFFYIIFMGAQWFMLGKEIDHRLKIYYRVNSSLDRVIYRIFLGMIAIILLFNLISLLSEKWIYNSFWITWSILGLFYSWPTRGKIIRESVATNFGEYRYLDSFEKTIFYLIIVFFIISLPAFPIVDDFTSLRLFFDPYSKIDGHLWNFIKVNYYPFFSYPQLLKIAISMHFYVIGMGLFLLVFYCFLRFFLVRRLALMGVFALISSWSFTKILEVNYGSSLMTTYSLLCIWGFLWVVKSATYRSGLFLGLTAFYGMLINQTFILVPVVQFLVLYFFTLKDRTYWYKRQLIKYAIFGWVLSLILFATNLDKFELLFPHGKTFVTLVLKAIEIKGFYVLSFIGFIVVSLKYLLPNISLIKNLKLNQNGLDYVVIIVSLFILNSFIFDAYLFNEFSIIWVLCFLSLVPVELIFQAISKLRSKRNMIYFSYILICLLDSHFEGRLKIFLKLFS